MDLPNLGFPHRELTHKIIGACFKIYNQLGSTYQEKHYQRVLEIELRGNLKIPFKRELEIDLEFEEKKFGKYLVDFVVDDKVAVEVKRIPKIVPQSQTQLPRYLNTLQLKVRNKESRLAGQVFKNQIRTEFLPLLKSVSFLLISASG